MCGQNPLVLSISHPFVGKILAGLLLDTLLSGSFSWHKLIGGLFVLGGLVLNLLIDKKAEQAVK